MSSIGLIEWNLELCHINQAVCKTKIGRRAGLKKLWDYSLVLAIFALVGPLPLLFPFVVTDPPSFWAGLFLSFSILNFPANFVTGNGSILNTWWICLKAINLRDFCASEVRSSFSWLVKFSMASLASFSQGSNNPGDPLSTQPPKIKDNYMIKMFKSLNQCFAQNSQNLLAGSTAALLETLF